MGGHSTRVFNNKIVENDTPNFAAPGQHRRQRADRHRRAPDGEPRTSTCSATRSTRTRPRMLMVSPTRSAFEDDRLQSAAARLRDPRQHLRRRRQQSAGPPVARSPRRWAASCRPSCGTASPGMASMATDRRGAHRRAREAGGWLHQSWPRRHADRPHQGQALDGPACPTPTSPEPPRRSCCRRTSLLRRRKALEVHDMTRLFRVSPGPRRA